VEVKGRLSCVPLFALWLTAGGVWSCAGVERKSFDRTSSACAAMPQAEGRAFSVAQSKRALDQAESEALACSAAAAKTTGRVAAVWGNPGCVMRVEFDLEGPELTPGDLDCIANAFLSMRMDPHPGAPVTTVIRLGR
jgi:hypothetical protein